MILLAPSRARLPGRPLHPVIPSGDRETATLTSWDTVRYILVLREGHGSIENKLHILGAMFAKGSSAYGRKLWPRVR